MSMSSETGPDSPALPISRTKAILLVCGVIAYQAVVYWLVVSQPEGGLGEGLMAAPLLVVAGCALWRTPRGRIMLVLLCAAGAIGLLLWRAAGANSALFYPVPYLVVYLGLLWLFGRTLVRGRQPLITRLASFVHGGLPADITRYTRQVTWAWCIFFAAMALTSVLLFAFAPLPAWSVFNNLLNLPLVVAMYLCESIWRRRRYPNFSHASMATVYRAFRDFDFNPPTAGR